MLISCSVVASRMQQCWCPRSIRRGHHVPFERAVAVHGEDEALGVAGQTTYLDLHQYGPERRRHYRCSVLHCILNAVCALG